MTAAILLIAGSVLRAAASAEAPELHTLVTPDAPAFVVLGVSPTQVQRPTDPREFAASFLNLAGEGSGVSIPTNFALETAPYWLFSHPRLTLEEYQAPSLQNLYRKLSISAATAAPPPGAPAGSLPRVAFGARTRLVDGNARGLSDECRAVVREATSRIGAAVAKYVATHPQATEAEIEEARAAADEGQQAVLGEKLPACIAQASVRKGFVADAAGGIGFSFNGARLSNGDFSDAGAWLSGGYLLEQLSALGLLRFTAQSLNAAADRYLDIGGKVAYAQGKWGAAAEGVVRVRLSGPGDDALHRVAITGDYQVSNGLWLTVTGGHGFTLAGASKFFGLLNVKASFDAKRSVSLSP